ncbi:hypothetical protein UFOVP131_38 [uncultured Caudovirales phage]|jgi:hypothetical protein|uniref:Uncharacterized protein n=1 Tax=uncultured Caudovirales phage TaxID=2100421 RepID=A0A6J5LFB1_9CAUD|nr:hypothetical protein UFOVP131_38 [uncultured Caudovirales phage]
MKSLAERHADRAQRKADGLAFSPNTKGDVGLAALRIGEAKTAIAALTPEQRSELEGLMAEDGFSDAAVYGDAYDARGSLKTAGIGVTNTLVAPVAFAQETERTAGPLGGMDGNGDGFASGGEGAGWGTLPEPSFDPANGNANGQAVADAAAGAAGGTGTGQSGSEGQEGAERPPVAASMKVADLEAIASKEGVDLTGATNNEQRVERIEAARKSA